MLIHRPMCGCEREMWRLAGPVYVVASPCDPEDSPSVADLSSSIAIWTKTKHFAARFQCIQALGFLNSCTFLDCFFACHVQNCNCCIKGQKTDGASLCTEGG